MAFGNVDFGVQVGWFAYDYQQVTLEYILWAIPLMTKTNCSQQAMYHSISYLPVFGLKHIEVIM